MERVECVVVLSRDRDRLVEALRPLGHVVTPASTSAEVLERIGDGGEGLLLLDAAALGEATLDLCAEVRERSAALPIVLLVPSEDRALRRAAFEAGVEAVLETTCEDLELRERVRSLLQLANLRSARERTRAQARAAAWVQRVYGAVGCGILVLRPDGVVIECNELAGEIYGAPASRLVGHRLRDFVTPLRPDGTPLDDEERMLRRVSSTGLPERRIDSCFVRADGEKRWTLLDLVPLRDADDELEFVVGSVLDVTERRRAEDAIRRSEAALREAQRLAKVGSFDLDLRTQTSWWSDELFRIYGLRAEDLKPEAYQAAFDRLIHPDDREAATSRRARTIREGGATSGHFRIVRPDGAVVHVAAAAEVVRDEAGTPVRFAGAIQDVTAAKRAAQEVTRLRDHFERVVSHIRDALLVVDEAGAVVYANPRFFELFGLPFGRPDGATLAPLMPVGFLDPTTSHGEPQPSETHEPYELRRADGEQLVVEAAVTPVLDGSKQIGKQALFRDVTDRWLSEQALHFLSNRMTRLPAADVFTAVVHELSRLLDVEGAMVGALVGANRATLRPLGFVRDREVAPATDFLVAGTLWAETLRHPDSVSLGGSGTTLVDCGAAVPLEAQGYGAIVLHDARHEPIGVLAVFSPRPLRRPDRAATLLRLFAIPIGAELGRRRVQGRFEDFYEHAPDATLILDETNTITMANRQSCRLFGCAREQLLGTNVDRLVPPATRPAHDFFRSRSSSTTKRTRVEAHRHDGTPFPAEVRYRPMLTEGGNLVVATIRDLSEALQAEQRRQALEAQLLQSQKMEAMGTLAGGIAHDFNNVLATIKANLDLARVGTSRDESVDDLLDQIEAAANHAVALVRRILSFSRKEEAKKVIHSLHRPIDRAVALLRPLLPPTVTLSVATEPTPPRVLGDGTQLQQVIINLGTNAWHALDGKPGRITITQDQVSVVAADNPGLLPPARYARVVVTDDGHGMDKTILPRIFEPFFTTKPSGVGSGLGLAMVHNIIRDHGGSVTVDSVLGEGTSFTVLLPIASGASESERPPSPVAAQPAEGPLHVMVVDDEQVLGRAAARFLGKLGYAASVFTEPREALVAFGIDPSEYDVLVLDLHMPGLTGLELARAALELRPGVPVILVSGRLDAKHHDAARALGVVEVLQKPYGLAELSDAILKAARR